MRLGPMRLNPNEWRSLGKASVFGVSKPGFKGPSAPSLVRRGRLAGVLIPVPLKVRTSGYFRGIPGSGLPLVVRIWKWWTPAAKGCSLVQTILFSGVTSTMEIPLLAA